MHKNDKNLPKRGLEAYQKYGGVILKLGVLLKIGLGTKNSPKRHQTPVKFGLKMASNANPTEFYENGTQLSQHRAIIFSTDTIYPKHAYNVHKNYPSQNFFF